LSVSLVHLDADPANSFDCMHRLWPACTFVFSQLCIVH